MSEGRRPDFRIMALDKETEDRGEVGAGWQKDDGSIYLKFNPFVTVPVGSRFSIPAFPIEETYDDRPRRGLEHPRKGGKVVHFKKRR